MNLPGPGVPGSVMLTDEEAREVQKRAIEVISEVGDKTLSTHWEGPFDLWGYRVAVPAWKRGKIVVFVTVDVKVDGYEWLHVSVSRKGGKLPDYEDMRMVRKAFLPKNLPSVEVWPPEEEHYSEAEVRHLWCRLPPGPPTVPDLRETDMMGKKGV
jgi:hypothetical protein